MPTGPHTVSHRVVAGGVRLICAVVVCAMLATGANAAMAAAAVGAAGARLGVGYPRVEQVAATCGAVDGATDAPGKSPFSIIRKAKGIPAATSPAEPVRVPLPDSAAVGRPYTAQPSCRPGMYPFSWQVRGPPVRPGIDCSPSGPAAQT